VICCISNDALGAGHTMAVDVKDSVIVAEVVRPESKRGVRGVWKQGDARHNIFIVRCCNCPNRNEVKEGFVSLRKMPEPERSEGRVVSLRKIQPFLGCLHQIAVTTAECIG
jgi:hypothetical protein